MTKGVLLIGVALALGACGADDESGEPRARTSTPETAATDGRPRPAATTSPDAAATAGTRIVARRSEFGPMIWGPRRQAIYVFERDDRGRSRCYGACAEAWPPVYTTGKPVAGVGVRQSLLGSIRRRGGRRQVTYAGKPLYYYAHEGSGEVLCHNVDLNGGLWWVVGPDGVPRP